ncbi:ABC transporter permease [Paenarthrobacter sp. A20]|nr:ABC transporter permease [Paenarthrobacter sp. A20]MCP1412586.1 hypothetical protein [Paenarthrobacter sp. A20]
MAEIPVYAMVENRIVDDRLTFSGVIKAGPAVPIQIDLEAQEPIVVRQTLQAGETLKWGDLAGVVSGKPYFVLPDPLPLYRDLSRGDEGDDVLALQRALMQMGYPSPENGHMDSATMEAASSFFASEGFTLSSGRMPTEQSQQVEPGATPETTAPSSGVDRITRLPHVVGASYVYSAVPADVRITRVKPSDLEPEAPLSLHSSSKNYFNDFGIDLIPHNIRSALDDPRAGPLAVVSTKAAIALDIPYSKKTGPVAGVSIWIDDRLVPVVGVFEPGPNFPEYADSVFVNASLMRGVSRSDLKVQVRTEKGFSAAIARVAPLGYSPSDPGKAKVDVTADIQSIRQDVSNDLGSLIALLSLVLMLLAIITAASSMYLTVQNRSAEIALRRAIGSSRWLICRSFILEGFIVGVTAGSLGGIIGTMTTLCVSWIQAWPPVLPPELWVVGLLVGATTGIVSAIYPAWVASRKDPAIALRA